jgi:hypothetical protein
MLIKKFRPGGKIPAHTKLAGHGAYIYSPSYSGSIRWEDSGSSWPRENMGDSA